MTHDVIGQNLLNFYRQPGFNVPQVFIHIIDYFHEDEKRMQGKDLFKRHGYNLLEEVDILESHIAFGNY